METEKIRIKKIVDIFYIYSKKGTIDTMTNRNNYGITFTDSGKITYIENDKKTVSTSSNIILLPKGANYKILRQESGFFPVINFDCEEKICDKITSFDIISSKNILKLFFELKESFMKNSTFESLSIFYKILSLIFEQSITDKSTQIQKYIDDNLTDSTLSNKKIADALNISESYLNKFFIKHYGISPKKYIIKKRIELAIIYLGENRYNIGQICEKCGYSNQYSFSRAFKNIRGISPLEFKKTIQNR